MGVELGGRLGGQGGCDQRGRVRVRGVGLGGQGECERRIEVFVKIQRRIRGGRGVGWGSRWM